MESNTMRPTNRDGDLQGILDALERLDERMRRLEVRAQKDFTASLNQVRDAEPAPQPGTTPAVVAPILDDYLFTPDGKQIVFGSKEMQQRYRAALGLPAHGRVQLTPEQQERGRKDLSWQRM